VANSNQGKGRIPSDLAFSEKSGKNIPPGNRIFLFTKPAFLREAENWGNACARAFQNSDI
jgi:hypothetical protein